MPKFIVVVGNPFDGMEIHGPFANADYAMAYAETFFEGDDSWTASLVSPNDENDAGHDWSGLNEEVQ